MLLRVPLLSILRNRRFKVDHFCDLISIGWSEVNLEGFGRPGGGLM